MKFNAMVILNYLMACIFIFAALVQYNDPDMGAWMVMYGAAAVACILYATGSYRRAVSAVVLAAALIWAGFITPEFFEGESFSLSTFNSVRMTNMEYETAREFGGLVIIALWMGIITFFTPASKG